MPFCWVCKRLVYGRRRSPLTCDCRTMWKFGGPPTGLQGNPLGLLDPPEYGDE